MINPRMRAFRGPLALVIAAAATVGLALLALPEADAGGSATISVGSQTFGLGDEASVQLAAAGVPDPGAAAWFIDIVYNNAILDATSCTVPQTTSVCNEAVLPNTVRVAGATTSPLNGDFKLATMGFTCLTAGTSPLTLSVYLFADSTQTDIPFTTTDGSITCSTEVPGDVDCNGLVGSVDALLILQFAAGLGQLPCPNGNVNGDTQTNAVDALLVLQFVVGLLPGLPT